MSFNLGTAIGYLDLDTSKFKKGFQSALGDLETFSKSSTGVSGKLTSLGSAFTSVGSTLTKNVTLPLVGVGAVGLKVASDFEKGMSEVKAISGATGKEFDALRDKAVELGADTAFSAGEVASAMTEMAKAGWNSQQIIDGMGGVLAAAAASGEGLASVSTIVADAVTGFGLVASDSTRVADLLTQAANSGTIGITDLGESFKYIAPVAGAMGFSIEDVTTAISAMSTAGIKGSQAGTSLRTLFTNLVNPTDAMAMAMLDLGLATFDAEQGWTSLVSNADGSMKSLDELVRMMREGMAGMTEEQKAATAAQLAGKTGMSGMLALMNLTQEEYDKIAESMENANGVASKTASVMQDNLQSKVEQLGGALESLAIKLADHVIPAVQKFVVWLTGVIDKFTELSPGIQGAIVKFAGIAAATGPVLTVFGKLLKIVGGMPATLAKAKSALAVLKGAIGAISAPVVAVIAVVGVLIAAFTNLWKNNEEFRNKVTEIWNGIVNMFAGFFQQITEKINSLGINFEGFGEVLKTLWQGLCDFLAPVFIGVFQFISDTLSTILDVILGIVDFFIAVFTGDWEGAWNAVKGIFESVWNGIVSWFETITGTIISAAQTVLSWFGVEWNTSTEEVGNTFKSIWQGIADFFINIWNGVRDFFTGLWKSIWDVVGPLFNEIVGTFQMAWDVIKLIWDRVQPFFAGIWEGIKAVFSIVGEWFKLVWGIAWEKIKAVWSVVVAWFTLIWENIKAVFSVVGTWFKGMFNIAWEAIKAIWNTVVAYFTMVWAGIKAVFAVVKGVLSGDFTDAWNAIKNLWDKAINYFRTLWDGVKNVFGAVGSFFANTFSAAWEAVKKVFHNFGSFFSSLWDTIKNTFSAIGTKIGSAIGSAVKSGINGVLGLIEGTVNTFIKAINGAVDLINLIPGVAIGKINLLSIPRLAKGGVVTRPTLAEIGEDGAEAVVPLEKNLGWIKNLVSMLMSSLAEFFSKQLRLAEQLEEIRATCQSLLDVGKAFVDVDSEYVPRRNPYAEAGARMKPDNPDPSTKPTGDTYNFYSPKAIDEIEAAKQIKRTKLELAEGF